MRTVVKVNASTVKRMEAACEEDNSIVATRADVATGKHSGYALEHFLGLGMRLGDLLRLERAGLAFRFRSKNVWLPGEQLPGGRGEVPREGNEYVAEVVERVDGKKVKIQKIFHKYSMRGKGSRVTWLLVIDDG